jgi:hypothetical protein
VEVKKAAAKKHFARGRKLFEKERYKQAIAAFLRAYRRWPYPVIHFNIALAYLFCGDDIAAVTHLRKYLVEASEGEIEIPKELKKAQHRVGVVIVSIPDDTADIYVDGKKAGIGNVELVLRPGRKRIEIRKEGQTIAARTFIVQGGKEQIWQLSWAAWKKKTKKLEAALLQQEQERKEQEELGESRKKRIAKLVELEASASHRLGRLHWGYFAGAAAVTGASLITSIALSARTVQLRDDFLDNRTDTDLRAQGVAHKRAAEIMWGVTGGFAVATAIVAIFTRWRPATETPDIQVTPVAGPTQAGIRIDW